MELLKNFSQIVIESPVDKIINQIKQLITSGQLKPGDKLPSERKLCDALGVGRTHLRDAIKKLEFYGILKTLPQSGTVVAGIGITALEGLISDVLKLEGNDFSSLVETRVILEVNSGVLAAEHRTAEDIRQIEKALLAHRARIAEADHAVEEDLMFHLKIAEASKNSVLKSLMLIITPDVLTYFKQHNVCGDGRSSNAVEQHEKILEAIKNQDRDVVGEVMRSHLGDILNYSKTIQVEQLYDNKSSSINGSSEK